MAFRIQIRRDTALRWSTNNPVLLQGEFGYETDADCLKIGDGINPWNDLPYLICGAAIDPVNIFEDGVLVVDGATGINFTGSGVSVSSSGGIATVTITGGTGTTGGSDIFVFEESISNPPVNSVGMTGMIFVGPNVTVTGSDGKVTVTIPGGTGTSGTSGTSGGEGPTGPSGTSGTSGTSGATGPTGPSGEGNLISVQDEGLTITSGVTGINFVGPGVTATNVGDLVTVSIPGSLSASSVPVYAIKLEFSGGNLVSSPFLSATDPEGNSLIGATGWTFTRNGNNEITVAHPLGKWFVNFNRFALQIAGGNEWVSGAISGPNFSTLSVKNFTNQSQFSIQALTTAQSGIAGSGTAYMFITWQEPTFDFYQ